MACPGPDLAADAWTQLAIGSWGTAPEIETNVSQPLLLTPGDHAGPTLG